MATVIYSVLPKEDIIVPYDFFIDAKDCSLLDLSMSNEHIDHDLIIFHSFFCYSSEINYRKLLANFINKEAAGSVIIVTRSDHQSMPVLLRALRTIGLDKIINVTRFGDNIHIKFSRNETDFKNGLANQILTEVTSGDVRCFLADLDKALVNNKPLSLVRVGHCEIKFLSYGYMYGDSDLKQTYQIQWGVDSVHHEFFEFVRRGVIESVKVSKYLGFNLITDISSGNLKVYENSVHRALSDFSMLKHYNVRVSPNIHYGLGTNENFLGLLHKAKRIVLVTSRAILADVFGQMYSSDKVSLIQLPGEFRVDGVFDFDKRSQIFVNAYNEIESLAEPGVVFLIGGGVAGKGYCSAVYQKGAIAIDVGSVFDAWAGVDSRGAGFDKRIKEFLSSCNA